MLQAAHHKRYPGFTIVELLIVIVVIGILATIVIVTYMSVTKQAQTSSLTLDVSAMDKAQKAYITLNNNPPLSYDSNGVPNDLLVFAANKGNSIIVRLKGASNYCIYGYNPGSFYPTPSTALVKSSDNTPCTPLSDSQPSNESSVYSTVAIIGQRLEAFKSQYGYYPHVDELTNIGLIIKPNNGNATQQQLYCRNDTNAIYLQLDQESDVIYVYETSSQDISEPTTLDKLSLSSVCPEFDISPSDPGFESTGIKDPDIS